MLLNQFNVLRKKNIFQHTDVAITARFLLYFCHLIKSINRIHTGNTIWNWSTGIPMNIKPFFTTFRLNSTLNITDTVKLSIFYAKDHNLLAQYYTRKWFYTSWSIYLQQSLIELKILLSRPHTAWPCSPPGLSLYYNTTVSRVKVSGHVMVSSCVRLLSISSRSLLKPAWADNKIRA